MDAPAPRKQAKKKRKYEGMPLPELKPRSAFQLFSDLNFRHVRARVVTAQREQKKKCLGKSERMDTIQNTLRSMWEGIGDEERRTFESLASLHRASYKAKKRIIMNNNSRLPPPPPPSSSSSSSTNANAQATEKPPPDATIVLTVAYDGSGYNGFQTQADASSVQDAMQIAMARALGGPIRLMACSRTDKGVHARGQVVAFRGRKDTDVKAFIVRLNEYLPKDIVIVDGRLAPLSFHPRHSSREKHYRYTIHNHPTRTVLGRKLVWHVKEALDIQAMQRAASLLEGTHDFTSFCAPDKSPASRRERAAEKKNGEGGAEKDCGDGDVRGGGDEGSSTNVREITSVRVTRRDDSEQSSSSSSSTVIIDVHGRSFLYKMVRIIVGTLVDIGLGRQHLGITELLEARERANTSTAPAQGLCLMKVRYDDEI
mmetsp:Transcript_23284/g.45409  ORF Transcript_23284/g.45409 Transcript_23284/m.45409 type:complete len:427 (-) Transcript_23284:107-1387(-)